MIAWGNVHRALKGVGGHRGMGAYLLPSRVRSVEAMASIHDMRPDPVCDFLPNAATSFSKTYSFRLFFQHKRIIALLLGRIARISKTHIRLYSLIWYSD